MKGRIYRIIDNTNGNVYYGSTIKEINKREIRHKAGYKLYLHGKLTKYTTSFCIIKNKDYKIELVEENEFETKRDLYERERYYIENNDCVNKQIPNRTDEEYKEYHKEYSKKYYETNKEKIAEKKKEKITCECDAIVCRTTLSRHKKSKKHLDKIIQDT